MLSVLNKEKIPKDSERCIGYPAMALKPAIVVCLILLVMMFMHFHTFPHFSFNAFALKATMTVLRDIKIAPMAGLKIIPNL